MEELATSPSNGGGETTAAVPAPAETSAPPSTRDALERAFETFDEKPADKTSAARDDAGRFAAKDKPASEPQTPAAAVHADQPLVKSATAPQRFSKAAQEAWAQAPEAVRSETERALSELTQGLEKYKTGAEAFEPLKRFAEMAQASGTTLDKALERYVGIEQSLRRDFVGGIAAICRNYGVDPRAVAQHLVGAQVQGGASPEVAALKAEISTLRRQVEGVGKATSERDVAAQVEAFARGAPEFDAVSETVVRLLQTGYATTIKDAYEAAVRLTPDVAARIEAAKAAETAAEKPPEKTPAEPAAHTRKAGLSVTGSPSGSNPGSRKPAGSAREALANAFSQHGL